MVTVLADAIEVSGKVRMFWADLLAREMWTIVIEADASAAGLLVNTGGKANPLGLLACRVTPVSPYRSRPKSNFVFELVGQRVRIGGTWCEWSDDDGLVRTVIEPISWIVVDRGVSAIVEEHGFSQVVRDVDVFAFSDEGDEPVTHHREDRHIDLLIPFPPKPQSNAVPRFTECDDRERDEAILYDYSSKPDQAFPIVRCPARSLSVVNGDSLHVVVDTGTPATGHGFYYAKFVLTHDEPFAEMCLPDVCRDDPGMSCQYTGEYRHTIIAPRLRSARVGDMLLGPADASGSSEGYSGHCSPRSGSTTGKRKWYGLNRQRLPGGTDGLYAYKQKERQDAGEELFGFHVRQGRGSRSRQRSSPSRGQSTRSSVTRWTM